MLGQNQVSLSSKQKLLKDVAKQAHKSPWLSLNCQATLQRLLGLLAVTLNIIV